MLDTLQESLFFKLKVFKINLLWEKIWPLSNLPWDNEII